jgi:ribonuclease HI
VSHDPHALKLYVDGNSYKNPGGAGGFACVAEYPEAWNRESEIVIQEGFHQTTINRMELLACIRALEYVADKGSALEVERVMIITDSKYVDNSHRMAHIWRHNDWKTAAGRPVENPDLWKKFLSVRGRVKTRTDIIWRKGKKTPLLKSVDRAAKEAGKSPSKDDRGFRTGKIARSKVLGGSSSLFPAKGQEVTIRVYRSAMIRKTGHKVYFDLFDDVSETFKEKFTAYVSGDYITALHRGHSYRVQFNCDIQYPQIVLICAALAQPPTNRT